MHLICLRMTLSSGESCRSIVRGPRAYYGYDKHSCRVLWCVQSDESSVCLCLFILTSECSYISMALVISIEYITKKDPETKMTRLETILIQTKELLRQYPGFQVFCTGHSLGGALSTLFGFYAAADDDIWTATLHNPVVIYSFASPYCGNWKFRYAFMHLERLRRLQHLRTANLEDMVTLLPFFAPKATVFSPLASAVLGAGNLYKHVGLRLQMEQGETRDDGKFHSLAYPKDYQSSDEDYAKEVKDSLEAGKSLAKAFYAVIRNDFERVKKHHRYVVIVLACPNSSGPLSGYV